MSDYSRFTIVLIDGEMWLWCLDCETIVQTVAGRLLPDICEWAESHNQSDHFDRCRCLTTNGPTGSSPSALGPSS
jgi:hypothetical protein